MKRSINDLMDMSLSKLGELVMTREAWCAAVRGVGELETERRGCLWDSLVGEGRPDCGGREPSPGQVFTVWSLEGKHLGGQGPDVSLLVGVGGGTGSGGGCLESHQEVGKDKVAGTAWSPPDAALTHQRHLFLPVCQVWPCHTPACPPLGRVQPPPLPEAALWLQSLDKASVEVSFATSWPPRKQPRNPHPVAALLRRKGWNVGWTGRGVRGTRMGCGWRRALFSFFFY